MSDEKKSTAHVPMTTGPLIERTQSFWIVIAFAAIQIIVGAFVLYGNTQLSNVQAQQKRFTECQAQYNQDFRETYDDINASSRKVSVGLYNVISLIPGLLDENTGPKEVLRFKEAAEQYTKVYNDLEAKRKATNYPAPPANFCGLKGK